MEQQIRTVLAAEAKLPVSIMTISNDDDLYAAGLTSHATVEVMMALEDEFDVEFPDAMLRRSTFGSISSIRQALLVLRAVSDPTESAVG